MVIVAFEEAEEPSAWPKASSMVVDSFGLRNFGQGFAAGRKGRVVVVGITASEAGRLTEEHHPEGDTMHSAE